MAVVRASSDRSDVEHVSHEKDYVTHHEYQRNGNLSPDDVAFLGNYPEDRRKKAVRKVDVRTL